MNLYVLRVDNIHMQMKFVAWFIVVGEGESSS